MNTTQDLASYLPIILAIIGFAFSLAAILLFLKKKKKQSQLVTQNLLSQESGLKAKLAQVFKNTRALDEKLAELEEILISGDVGIQTTSLLIDKIRTQAKEMNREEQNNFELKTSIKKEILSILEDPIQLTQATQSTQQNTQEKPEVLFIVGINGVGKTTSIAKLAYQYKQQGKKVLLVAGDTFRAGAIEQLKIWAERLDFPIIAQKEGADPGAVSFDGVKSGIAKEVDIVIIDTAGRLHTKSNLMEELKKVKRVIAKAMPSAPHQTLWVLDGTTGQNSLSQGKEFHAALGLDGVIISKLDGTPKGGSVIAIAEQLKIPIRYVGLGEKMEDLREFKPQEFVEALIG